jgi:hypothetical protein
MDSSFCSVEFSQSDVVEDSSISATHAQLLSARVMACEKNHVKHRALAMSWHLASRPAAVQFDSRNLKARLQQTSMPRARDKTLVDYTIQTLRPAP